MKAPIEAPTIKLNPGMGQRKPNTDREVILFDIPEPGNNDVLSGRGVTTNKHAGNVNFRSLVALNKGKSKDTYTQQTATALVLKNHGGKIWRLRKFPANYQHHATFCAM